MKLFLCFFFGVFLFLETQARPKKGFLAQDFALYTSTDLSFTHLYYNAGGQRDSRREFLSNNCLMQSIGIEYYIFCLEYATALPTNLFYANSPLSKINRLSLTGSYKHLRFNASFSEIKGYYSLTEPISGEILDYPIDPRYRKDAFTFEVQGNIAYFFNKTYRYSLSLTRIYEQNQSGYTFYIRYNPRYAEFSIPSSFYQESELFPGSNDMKQLKRLSLMEQALTGGVSGLWTNGHWFIEGQFGLGIGLQWQWFTINNEHRKNLSPSPILDAKFTGGYKTKYGLYFSFIGDLEVLTAFFPEKTTYNRLNNLFSICVGVQMNEALKNKGKKK